MRVALLIDGQEGVEWPQWVALARAVEEAGLDGLLSSDHYGSIYRGDPAGAFDAWATLTALAATTSGICLGTLVSPVTFRPASVLAKNVVTADHISGGRVELGIGGGWFEPEHNAYGFRLGSLGDRLDELDRQLAEIVRQWTTAEDIWPKPLRQPRPPIIVGGKGKPRTIQAAVAWADEYNTFDFGCSIEELRERHRILSEAAHQAGREPLRFSVMHSCVVGRNDSELAERTQIWRAISPNGPGPELHGTVDQVVERLREYRSAGVDRAILQHLAHEDLDMVHLLGEVAARLR